MSTETSQTSTQEALALLPLPGLDGLSEAQVRGTACVWDGIILTAETAINLGPRRKKHLGNAYDWFPRACKACAGTATAALRALHDHALACEECRKNAGGCPTGLALMRLIRDGYRAIGSGQAFVELFDRIVDPVTACEPCTFAKIFGGAHACTGAAAMPADRSCPCCGKGVSR